MDMNQTPTANRYAIGLFGRRNAGKSSLINALAGQPIAVTSDVPGTTTDPVKKAMELLPIGPVVLIDTAGRYTTQDSDATNDSNVTPGRETGTAMPRASALFCT